ncbi:MAG: hypothetical protein H7246_05590 [Phycisphaerae bacterium]|nr:hypothetical protein [Saprospiraceae bacterium]
MKRPIGIILLFACSTLLPTSLFSQNPLLFDTTNRCILTGNFFGEELYSFTGDPAVEAMVTRILDYANVSKNFRVVNTNVVSLAAVVGKDEQYLLYNSEFFIEHQADTVLRFALLAHEIGHLVKHHSLSAKKRLREESEADQFLGQVMRDLGFSLDKVLATADFPGYSYNITPTERKKTIRKAWESKDAQLRSGENAGYLDEETLKNLPIPRFPWPPPQCPRRSEVDNTLFSKCKLLEDVDGRLAKALDDSKYGQRSYFYVPNGFALVTQFEQYKMDGSSLAEVDRWKDYPIPPDADWTETFKRFFTGYTGYFRILVFVVTDKPFVMDTSSAISADTGKSWLMAGGNRLPTEIGKMPYLSNYRVTLLVYEFEAKSATKTADKKCPGRLEPGIHLLKSGIKQLIKKC